MRQRKFAEVRPEGMGGDILDHHLPAGERRRAARSYLSAQHSLPDILRARAREGAGALSDGERRAVEEALAALLERARDGSFDREALGRLSAAGVLRERPFTSTVPVIGPLIARFRAAWNNVASRWYLNHLMTQQNAFNALAVSHLERYETELREQMALLEEEIVITTELQERVARLEAQLAALRKARSGE